MSLLHVPSFKGFASALQQDKTARKFVLVQLGTTTSSGIGTISGAITLDPSSAANWNEINNHYDEFRVLGIRIKLYSAQQFSVTALNGPVYFALDNDDTTLPASSGTLLVYTDKVIVPAVFTHHPSNSGSPDCSLNLGFKRPQNSSSPIAWIDVAVPALSLGAIKLASAIAGLSINTKYYDFYIEYFVEARGRR